MKAWTLLTILLAANVSIARGQFDLGRSIEDSIFPIGEASLLTTVDQVLDAAVAPFATRAEPETKAVHLQFELGTATKMWLVNELTYRYEHGQLVGVLLRPDAGDDIHLDVSGDNDQWEMVTLVDGEALRSRLDIERFDDGQIKRVRATQSGTLTREVVVTERTESGSPRKIRIRDGIGDATTDILFDDRGRVLSMNREDEQHPIRFRWTDERRIDVIADPNAPPLLRATLDGDGYSIAWAFADARYIGGRYWKREFVRDHAGRWTNMTVSTRAKPESEWTRAFRYSRKFLQDP